MHNYDNKMTKEQLEWALANDEEARKLIEAAKIELMRHSPFYGVMLSNMPVKNATNWLETAATDGRTLYYNTEFIAGMIEERKKMTKERAEAMMPDQKSKDELLKHLDVFYRRKTIREVVFILCHEVRHIVSDHASRGRGFDHRLYNIAADHYINTDLVMLYSVSSKMVKKPWFPQGDKTDFKLINDDDEWAFTKSCYCDFRFKDMYTEKIYEVLQKEEQEKKDKGEDTGQGLKGGDMHQDNSGRIGGDNEGRAKDGSGKAGKGDVQDVLGLDPFAQPRLSQEQKNANDTVMRRSIENACKAAGDEAPEEARAFVDAIGKPKINYLRLLRKTVERWMKQDVSYKRLSRRSFSTTRTLRKSGYISAGQTIALPSQNKAKTIKAGLYPDVSGSFTDDMLLPTFREMKGLCNQYEDFEVELACWSTHVGDVLKMTKHNINDFKKYQIKTSGGTHVSCLFKYLDEQGSNAPDQIVIYTDGYFEDLSSHSEWRKRYGYRTLWVILGDNHNWQAPFGQAVVFDKYIK